MTKLEFLTKFQRELNRRNVEDADEILEEYTQHFAFKLADGYAEEEIAAKLGDPETLAAQFKPIPSAEAKHSPVLTWLWLGWVDLFFGVFAALLVSFGAVLVACALSFGVTGICLIGDLGRLSFVYLPTMPYWCGAILGVGLLALCVLSVIGCVWYFALCRQIFRSYGRFHRNALAQSRGAATLPSLPLAPQFAPKKKRRLRTVVLLSLLVFASCFVVGYAACSLSAGTLEFWHAWGWFGYAG